MPLGLCSPLLAFKIVAQYSSSDNLLWKIPRAKVCWIACLHIHIFNVLEQPLLYYAKSHYWFFVVVGGGFFNATIRYSCSKISILCSKYETVIVTIFFASHSCLYDFVVVVVSCFLFCFFCFDFTITSPPPSTHLFPLRFEPTLIVGIRRIYKLNYDFAILSH